MPIAILPELTRTLLATGRVLAPWNQLVELEHQLLRRARSAFIVRWFGTSVPESRLSLSIAIVNIDALRRRYHQATRSVTAGPTGPNLLGPIAGIAGLLVGIAGSFPGTMLTAAHADEIFDHLVGDNIGSGLLTMLFSLFGGWIVPPLVLLIGAGGSPAFLAAGLSSAIGHEPTRAVVLLLGEAAAFITAASAFWEQLSGPREKIRNPLLARIMLFADGLAKAFAHTLGFVAILVTKIAPLLPNLVAQFGALLALVSSVFDAVKDVTTGLAAALMAPFRADGGIAAILKGLLHRIGELPDIALKEIDKLITALATALTSAGKQISTAITTFADTIAPGLVQLFKDSVIGQLVDRIKKFLAMLPDIVDAFKNAPKPKEEPEEEDALRKWYLWLLLQGLTYDIANMLDSAAALKLPPTAALEVPEFPDLPELPDITDITTRIGRPEGIDPAALERRLATTGESVRAKMAIPQELLRRPRSAFAGERARLAAAGHPVLRPPGDEPWQLGDNQLRDLIYLAVGRVLPPALRSMAQDVKSAFDTADVEVYQTKPEQLDQPMLELEDNGRLRPVVSKLTIRSDALAADIRGFRDVLVGELEARTYLAPAR